MADPSFLYKLALEQVGSLRPIPADLGVWDHPYSRYLRPAPCRAGWWRRHCVRICECVLPLTPDPASVLRVVSFVSLQGITLASGIAYETQMRGSKLSQEADLAAVNVGSLLAANAAVVWTLAPTRSYG